MWANAASLWFPSAVLVPHTHTQSSSNTQSSDPGQGLCVSEDVFQLFGFMKVLVNQTFFKNNTDLDDKECLVTL